MGVDVIEAGFPIASNGDFEACARSPKHRHRGPRHLRPGPRRREADIERCAEAMQAGHARPHPHLPRPPARCTWSTSCRWRREEVLERSRRSVTPGPQPHATTWSGRPRTPPAPSGTSCAAASRRPSSAGATTINIPDTVGYATAGRIRRDVPRLHRARARRRRGHLLHPLPQRPGPGGRQLAGRACRPARARWSAPSTASASGPATPRWKRS